jgi:hypothetical protein
MMDTSCIGQPATVSSAPMETGKEFANRVYAPIDVDHLMMGNSLITCHNHGAREVLHRDMVVWHRVQRKLLNHCELIHHSFFRPIQPAAQERALTVDEIGCSYVRRSRMARYRLIANTCPSTSITWALWYCWLLITITVSVCSCATTR